MGERARKAWGRGMEAKSTSSEGRVEASAMVRGRGAWSEPSRVEATAMGGGREPDATLGSGGMGGASVLMGRGSAVDASGSLEGLERPGSEGMRALDRVTRGERPPMTGSMQ